VSQGEVKPFRKGVKIDVEFGIRKNYSGSLYYVQKWGGYQVAGLEPNTGTLNTQKWWSHGILEVISRFLSTGTGKVRIFVPKH
jgi:hypothetical protein